MKAAGVIMKKMGEKATKEEGVPAHGPEYVRLVSDDDGEEYYIKREVAMAHDEMKHMLTYPDGSIKPELIFFGISSKKIKDTCVYLTCQAHYGDNLPQ